jgi:hypothetical protein
MAKVLLEIFLQQFPLQKNVSHNAFVRRHRDSMTGLSTVQED